MVAHQDQSMLRDSEYVESGTIISIVAQQACVISNENLRNPRLSKALDTRSFCISADNDFDIVRGPHPIRGT